jgi:hypothetical protein
MAAKTPAGPAPMTTIRRAVIPGFVASARAASTVSASIVSHARSAISMSSM